MRPAGAELELVFDTLADVTVDSDGRGLSQARVVRTPSRRPSWPARVGPDFLGGREHHRPDLAVSAPDVVLAAVAAPTSASGLVRR